MLISFCGGDKIATVTLFVQLVVVIDVPSVLPR
jgi:hypothetical protein